MAQDNSYLGEYLPAPLPETLQEKIRALEIELNQELNEKNLLLMVFQPKQEAWGDY